MKVRVCLFSLSVDLNYKEIWEYLWEEFYPIVHLILFFSDFKWLLITCLDIYLNFFISLTTLLSSMPLQIPCQVSINNVLWFPTRKILMSWGLLWDSLAFKILLKNQILDCQKSKNQKWYWVAGSRRWSLQVSRNGR